MPGTNSGVLEERAAKGALVADEAQLASEEQADIGSLTGWQALADQVNFSTQDAVLSCGEGRPLARSNHGCLTCAAEHLGLWI